MSGGGKTFRLFVSSTFSDMKAERNALQERTFPKLKRLCRGRGWDFSVIDLRWGVPDEAALDQQTMKICLEEVERCQGTGLKPNFMILLGDRYGWQPLPAEIEKREFQDLLAATTGEGDRDLLSLWYKCDENAIPPVFQLQPRSGPRAEYAEWTRWDPVERRLRGVMQSVVAASGWAPDRRVKYETSATEQEILLGALNVPDAPRHVHAFVRQIQGLPEDDSARDFIDLGFDSRRDAAAMARLADLKRRMKETLGNTVHQYQADWRTGGISLTHLDALCADVERYLSALILEEMNARESRDRVAVEDDAHDAFGAGLTERFVGRVEDLEAIAGYLKSDARVPFGITADAGLGKSALLAHAFETLVPPRSGEIALRRFVGATPESVDVRHLLQGILLRIRDGDGEDEPLPDTIRDLMAAFQERLRKDRPERPLTLFIDGLDQLAGADPGRKLSWLPNVLGKGVKIVISAKTGTGPAEILGRLLPASALHRLGPMCAADGRELLSAWLGARRRCLQPAQEDQILDRFRSLGNPLFLRLCFEEARHWRSYSPTTTIGASVREVLTGLWERWSVRHGAMLMRRVSVYIASAREGLSQDELMSVLAGDEEYFRFFLATAHHALPDAGENTVGRRLPIVIFLRLYQDVRALLVERQVAGSLLLGFFHSQVAEFILEPRSGTQEPNWHDLLADFFALQPDRYEDRPNIRKFRELVWQRIHAGNRELVLQHLTDPVFLEGKCRADLLFDVLGDFDLALSCLKELRGSPDLGEFHRFIRQQAYALKEFPELFFQQAVNQPDASAPHLHVLPLLRDSGTPYLTWVSKPQTLDPCVLSLTGHAGPVRCAEMSPDGGRIASGGEDGVFKLWDVAAGMEEWNVSLAAGAVRCCSFSADGDTVVVGTGHGEIIVVDVLTAAERQRWTAHDLAINAVGCIPRSGSVFSVSDDGRVRIWDPAAGGLLREWKEQHPEGVPLPEHPFRLFAGIAAPDGSCLAVAGEDRQIRILSVSDLQPKGILSGHQGWVRCLAFSADASILASGATDGNLRIWKAETAVLIREICAHTDWVRSCAIHGDRLVSGGGDHRIRVWRIDSEAAEEFGFGIGDRVTVTRFSPDGFRLLSAGNDAIVRLWDTQLAPASEILPRHDSRVNAGVFMERENVLITASDDASIKTWDLATGAVRAGFVSFSGRVLWVRWSGYEDWMISGGDDPTLHAWRLSKPEETRVFSGHRGWLLNARGIPGKKLLVSSSADCTVKIWDWESGALRFDCRGHSKPVWGLAISPDGGRIVSAGDDQVLKLWDPSSGQETANLRGHGDAVRTCLFHPDGVRLISGALDGSLKIWNVSSGTVLLSLAGHSRGVSAGDISPDGKTILSGAEDGSLKLWEVSGGMLTAEVSGHGAAVLSAGFSPDGLLTAASYADGQLILREAESGAVCGRWKNSCPLHGVGFSPSGKFLNVGDDAGTVFLCRLERFPRGLPRITAWKSPSRWLGLRGGVTGYACPFCGKWHRLDAMEAFTAVCASCGFKVVLNEFFVQSDPSPWLST
jgi:WD40 repeat protein